MSRICTKYGGFALYTDCLECEDKNICKQNYRQAQLQKGDERKEPSRVSIGIDQSYKRTGFSVVEDGKLVEVGSVDLSKLSCKADKRNAVKARLNWILDVLTDQKNVKPSKIIVVIEQIRQFSQGFINMSYIKGIGALNATIADLAHSYGVRTYSIDTRCWKATVIGTSKPKENSFGVPPEKWPTLEWLISKGFKESVRLEVEGRRTKGTFLSKDGRRYEYDNDAADSAAIAMFPWVGDKSKLKLED